MIVLGVVAACLHQPLRPTPESEIVAYPTRGRIAVTVDVTRGRAQLLINSFETTSLPLPQDRHGVAMETCRVVEPQSLRLGPASEANATATCGGVDLPLTEVGVGAWVHVFDPLPSEGLVCEVSLDGNTLLLPPLPASPEISLRGRRISWSPAEGDELRVIVPQSGSMSSICRFEDDGRGRGIARGAIAFATRYRYAHLVVADGTIVPVTVMTGVWWDDS